MIEILKLSEYEERTGKTPAMTKKLIKDGKLKGGQDGPNGHWYVQVESNDEVAHLKELIVTQDKKIDALCKHLGVQI
jgi:hypothetical protein